VYLERKFKIYCLTIMDSYDTKQNKHHPREPSKIQTECWLSRYSDYVRGMQTLKSGVRFPRERTLVILLQKLIDNVPDEAEICRRLITDS
jgi:hypothetical protein